MKYWKGQIKEHYYRRLSTWEGFRIITSLSQKHVAQNMAIIEDRLYTKIEEGITIIEDCLLNG